MFLQDVSPSLCKGPPLARAYNYVKFIERGGGEGGKRGGRGTFLAKTRSIGDADEKLNTSPASQITCLNRGPSLVLNKP